MGTLLLSVQLRHELLHARLHLQVGLDSSVSTRPVGAPEGVGRPVCEEHISVASVRSFHDVVFAIHPDGHEAEPGRVASLTKPQQPGAGHRLPGCAFRAPKG